MAGHSKWKNIQHRKGAQDARREKIITKLAKAITVAARLGGEDPNSNPRLRGFIDKALDANMTKDAILRAIKRGVGGGDASQLLEVRYEGYGPSGAAVLVDCLTDNRNRTVADVRHAFTKHGGQLGADGSVSYLFKKQGLITLTGVQDVDRVMEVVLDAGAEDIQMQEDGAVEIVTDPHFVK